MSLFYLGSYSQVWGLIFLVLCKIKCKTRQIKTSLSFCTLCDSFCETVKILMDVISPLLQFFTSSTWVPDTMGPNLRCEQESSDDFSDYRLGQLFDLVEVNEEDEQLLRDLVNQHKDDEASSAKSEARQKLVDLEKLIISPNDEVRRQAEYELKQLLDEHKKNSQEQKETVETDREVEAVNSDSEEEESAQRKEQICTNFKGKFF